MEVNPHNTNKDKETCKTMKCEINTLVTKERVEFMFTLFDQFFGWVGGGAGRTN